MALVIGQDAPPLTGQTIPGNQNWQLSNHRLSVMVLKFSGPSWCAPCRQMAPIVNQAHQEFPEPDVKFVLVGFQEDNDANFQGALNALGITFTAIQPDNATLAEYHVSGVPTTVILDTLHRVYSVHAGQKTIEELRADIQGALETSPTREEIGGCLNAVLGGLLNRKNKSKKNTESKMGKSTKSGAFEEI